MYATNIKDQLFSAALPLKPLVCWCGSAESVTVAVPPMPAVAGLAVSGVSVKLTLPDGAVRSVSAVAVPASPLWRATFPAELFATAGRVADGLEVTLFGKDEQGVERAWIVAKGDLEVRAGDAAPTPGESFCLVKLRDGAPEDPVEGDAYVSGGTLYLYDDGAWVQIGGGGGGVTVDDEMSSTSENPVQNKVITAALEGKQGTLTAAQLAAANSGATAAKVAAWDGYAEQIAAKADAADVNAALAQKADADALPYSLVVPGEWTFAPLPDGVTSVEFYGYSSGDGWGISVNGDAPVYAGLNEPNAVELEWDVYGDGTCVVTATRASLPGHLADRAVNAVAVSSATALTLPAANPGHARDLLVRLTISGSTVPTITFAAPTGESLTYETDGDGFPAPDAEGNWLYSFTETAAHTFAVALKSVSVVTQGGS